MFNPRQNNGMPTQAIAQALGGGQPQPGPMPPLNNGMGQGGGMPGMAKPPMGTGLMPPPRPMAPMPPMGRGNNEGREGRGGMPLSPRPMMSLGGGGGMPAMPQGVGRPELGALLQMLQRGRG